MWDIGILFDSV